LLSDVIARQKAVSSVRAKEWSNLLVFTSQTRTVFAVEARYLPSGEKATALASTLWLSRTGPGLRVAVSHSRRVASVAQAMHFPSGLRAMDVIASLSPAPTKRPRSLPDLVSHTRTVSSPA